MITTLAVNCATILVCTNDDEKTAAETASDGMVMGTVRVLCEFSLLVPQQTRSDLSLTALDDALKGLYLKKGAFQDHKMLKSAKVIVDAELARGSHQLREQNIHIIHAIMEVQVYWAGKVTASK